MTILDYIRSAKPDQGDYRNPMGMQQTKDRKIEITIAREIAPLKRLGAILFTPALFVAFFWAIFIIETEGLSPRSDYFLVLAGCIKGLITEGSTECVPDLGYIVFCSILGGPFVIIISYKIWQALNTKIVLTEQSIIKKQPWNKKIQFGWNEIKKIEIFEGLKGTELMFTRNSGSALFGNSNRFFCPLILRNKRASLSSAAANLILNKIDTYSIFVKGDREALEQMVQVPHQKRQGPLRSVTPNMSGRNRFQHRPPSIQKSADN